ncbi:MAG TPA: carbohydrate kinase family protein [Bryobacteraceae bacterium]|nr:carbohydrate kinase family protein [Bryobacteraceae bacterium]
MLCDGAVVKKSGVVIIGEFFIDEVFTEFNTFPKPGEESFARNFQREIGGGAAITACGLARLGVPVKVLGAVGKADGAYVIDKLTSFGVDCSDLLLDSTAPTGITVSASTREDRAFFSYYGANRRLEKILRKDEIARVLGSARHVHFACAPEPETHTALFAALDRRCRVSIDVQSHHSWLTLPESLNILRHCDVFFPNEREGGWIAAALEPHEILRRLGDKGLRGVALKLGGKGAALLWNQRQFLADPIPVETVDTTGAGDCFDAGFIFALLQGYDPQRCLQIANICGALSTRALGGIGAFPSPAELARYDALYCKEKSGRKK